MQQISTYDFTSRINHWVIALGMIGMLGLGLYLAYGGLSPAERGALIDIHKAIGSGVHQFAGYGLVFLIVLHIAAALKHHFYDADATLHRMLRGFSQSDRVG